MLKNNLLNSKIWAANAVDDNIDSSSIDNKEKNDNIIDLAFEKIQLNVIEKELEIQRNFIKNEIDKQKKVNPANLSIGLIQTTNWENQCLMKADYSH